MSIALVIELLQRAAGAGIDLYAVWKKANASIKYDGTVDADAYADLVSETDKQIALLRKNEVDARGV